MNFTVLSMDSDKCPVKGVGVYKEECFFVEGNGQDFREIVGNINRLIKSKNIQYAINYKDQNVMFYGDHDELKNLNNKLQDILLFG